jgi:diguanylate cyclase (GGDEF)-like protein/PAS domain S-box-containing protein
MREQNQSQDDEGSRHAAELLAARSLQGMTSGQLESFFQLSLDLICVASADGYFVRLNPAWERTLGYTQEELLSRSFLDFVHAEDQDASSANAGELPKAFPSTHFANRYRCKDGSYKWLEWNTTPAGDDGLRYAVARDVTAAKLAEQLLRYREHQLVEAQAIAGFGSWEWDLATDAVKWSDGLFRILGLESAAFDPEFSSYLLFVHPDDAKSLAQTMRAARTVGSYQEEHRVVLQSGEVRFMQGRGRVLSDERGKATRLIGTIHDVSDRNRAEEQNRLLARVARIISEATDIDAGLELSLRELCEAGSWDYGEFWFPDEGGVALARHRARYVRDPSASELLREVSSLPRSLRDDALPDRVWKSGIVAWYSDPARADDSVLGRVDEAPPSELKTCVAVPLPLEDRVVGVLLLQRHQAVARDERQLVVLQASAAQLGGWMQRKRAERSLRAREERLRFAARASNDVIYDWDLSTNKLWLGESLLRALGHCIEDADIGWWGALIHPDDSAQVHLTLEAALDSADTLWSGEYRFARADGSYAHVFDRGYILRSPDGKALRMIGSMMDMSERVRAAETLREAKEAAESAVRAKSQFLANMSHEIRTPLTAVLGFADLLLDRKLSPSDRLNHVRTIRRNGEHLLTILNDILDISKVEAGKLVIEKIECSPVQVLTDVASLMRVRAIEKGLSFAVDFDGPLPTSVRTDPTRLRQIVLNLVSNAIKFTERGGVRITAHYEESEQQQALSIRVSDTGIGMDALQVSRLFQPFTQADASMTRRYGGSGLGLGICAPLAAALGGVIAVESEPTHGSTFTLRLPVEVAAGSAMLSDPREALRDARESLPPPAADHVQRGHVLLAEDGHDNQVLIATLLRAHGFEVTVVTNGRLAVERVLLRAGSGPPFDVVLMDMQMPELDGYGATAQLRAQGYRGTIVALTAHAMGGERERCMTAGCDDYLTKPIDRARLIAAVSEHVDRSRRGMPRSGAPESECTPEARSGSEAPVAVSERLVSEFADDPEMAAIVARFVSGLPAQHAALVDAAERQERPLLLRLAHQLKGAAGGYGFPIIGESAARLEALAHSAEGSLMPALDELLALSRRTQIASVLSTRPSESACLPTVLVIDDSTQIQELVEARLCTEQIALFKAGSAAEGLLLARQLLPDLVLLDIDLPDGNGFDVCRALKADPRTTSTPILFLTGTSDPTIKAAALDLGAMDYVTKPFETAELRARVRSALRSKRYHDLLATRAQIDGLTGLWNRMHFDARLTEELSAAVRHGHALSIAMLDLDHFKLLNDSYGHPFGDRVLQSVAAVLRKTVRTSDVVCRYGGEELVVIMRQTGARDALVSAGRMRSAIAALGTTVNRRSVSLTASFGVAALEHGEPLERSLVTAAAMVAAADAALYCSKRAGRNQVSLGTIADS